MTAPISRIDVDPIGTFMPWSSDEERALRLRLLRARNIAASRAVASPSPGARALFWLANEMAGNWVFAHVAADDLDSALRALTYMFMAASTVERVCADDKELAA